MQGAADTTRALQAHGCHRGGTATQSDGTVTQADGTVKQFLFCHHCHGNLGPEKMGIVTSLSEWQHRVHFKAVLPLLQRVATNIVMLNATIHQQGSGLWNSLYYSESCLWSVWWAAGVPRAIFMLTNHGLSVSIGVSSRDEMGGQEISLIPYHNPHTGDREVLVQERCNSSVSTVELHLSCINPSIGWHLCSRVMKTLNAHTGLGIPFLSNQAQK